MLFTPRRFCLPLAIVLSAFRSVYGGVVTLYYVSEQSTTTSFSGSASIEEAGTTIVSAIGPGDAGMTRYEVQQIQSKLIVHELQTTITFLDAPVTVTYTIEQGANTAYASAPPLVTQPQVDQTFRFQGLIQNCSLDISHKTGECVEVDQNPSLVFGSGDASSTKIVTSSKTFTGQLLPLATITQTQAAAATTGSGPGAATSDAILNSKVAVLQAAFLLSAMCAIITF